MHRGPEESTFWSFWDVRAKKVWWTDAVLNATAARNLLRKRKLFVSMQSNVSTQFSAPHDCSAGGWPPFISSRVFPPQRRYCVCIFIHPTASGSSQSSQTRRIDRASSFVASYLTSFMMVAERKDKSFAEVQKITASKRRHRAAALRIASLSHWYDVTKYRMSDGTR